MTVRRKAIVAPTRRQELSLDESVCLAWVALRTFGYELPGECNAAFLSVLLGGGSVDAGTHPAVRATIALWSGRAGEPLVMDGMWSWSGTSQLRADVRAMLDRTGVVYEDRRTQQMCSAAYRRKRKIAERASPETPFLDPSGAVVHLSRVEQLEPMQTMLRALTGVLDACSSGAPLAIDPLAD